MKNLTSPELERYRMRDWPVEPEVREWEGAFAVPHSVRLVGRIGQRTILRVIASRGGCPYGDDRDEANHWDHVSVSTPTRCPTWEEMEFVKRLFFERNECAMQLHVPPAEHINNHEFCLHIWRPLDLAIPRPPGIMVGIVGMTGMEKLERLIR